jgi:hypothetical protein
MSSTTSSAASSATAHADPHTPWGRVVGIGVALAAVVALIVLAFSWPGVTSEPKNVPLAIVGPDAQVEALEAALDERAAGLFEVTTVDDRDAAVEAIETREVYGAILLGPDAEVLTASAGSPIVAQQLTAFAAVLQGQLQEAVAAQVPEGVTPPTVTVAVTDVVPLAESALGVYVVVGGLTIAGIMQGWFGVLQGDYLLNAAVLAAGLLAIGATIVGFAALVGRPGVAIGPVLFLLIANPISSAAQPVEFLAEPWGAVGQWFPPGAGATLLRDASYFPAADTTFPWLVLASWAAAGILLALVGHHRATGAASREALEEADA